MTTLASKPPGPGNRLRRLLGIGSLPDWLFRLVCQGSALVVIVLVLLIVALLAQQAGPAIRRAGIAIVASNDWAPGQGDFGGLAFVYGSILTSLLALAIAIPLGVGSAAFLAEVAPGWLKRGGSFLIELLAAIPSVVYGFWGVTFLAPNVQKFFNLLGGPNIGGKGLFSAGLILAVMVVPYVAAVSFDVCRAVPRSQREAALAVGATRWQTIWRVVLPYARPGIIGGCFLALGRALGETMAVTMLIGNTPVIEGLPFGRGNTIPSVLAQELPGTQSVVEQSALLELALLLFGVTILMNVLARMLIWRVGRVRRGPSLWSRLRGRPQVPLPPYPDTPEKTIANFRRAGLIDRVMTGALGLCLVITCIPLFLILGYITYRGVGALDWGLFTELPRPQGVPGGGVANAIVGSAMLVSLASLFALPLGILAAVFLAEYRRSRLGSAVRFFGELLNGVPSIVVGTFVYALVRLLIQAGALPPDRQFSGWAGAFALGIMMMPVVMRSTEEALKLVPGTLRSASHALGAHQWQTVLRVTLPAALPAIITGAFLAIARIAGETAPLLLTAFGNDSWAFSPNDEVAFLPLYIFRYSLSGDPIFERMAWGAAFVLLAFVMALNIGIRFLTGRRVVLASHAD